LSVGKKKFNTFGGVFTPSILTILGVIMYLRLGWVVGNAGLWGSILIVVIAHVISITTGLSISSIATDKKVGAGGVYYVLSRSLGLPIGGAIGLTLFVGTALSIALYIVGFSESFNGTVGLDPGINNIRLTGSIALLALTIIAFISTSLAIKTQYFILAAIFISIGVIFLGKPISPPEVVPVFGGADGLPLEAVFAIFFPAVTGFTAGIAMSGDLKDPKSSIPIGTISAIAVGFVVYMILVVFLAVKVDPELLRTDYNILMKVAVFAPAVVAGIWGATLSSALGGILGGPRILQAMSLDKITPLVFGKEQGKTKEPRYALIVAIILAECGILIGDLDIVARIVSMFYLAAYGFINISFFLESWASSDFRPSFKVNKWFGFIGFVATFGVMFKLDMLAMILALIIIGGIYLWLARKEIALGTGDIWQSVWSTGVKEGLRRLESKADHKRNWKPNILLFSGNSEARPHLIAFSQALAGRSGMVTNFDLIENKGMDILFPKHKQSVRDELLQKHGIFGRRIEVKNVYKGIESIATTFGFSGLDPNTVLMGWARNTKDPIWFAQTTQKLIDLDYNVLYLDFDKERGFGQREQIDLWWRGISNNSELMLQIAKFVSFNTDWRNAKIRILLVNDFNVDRRIIENRISKLLDEFRLQAEIKVIDNHVEKKPFYDILKAHSLRSDLVFIGIPFIVPGSESLFVKNTSDLTEIIGTVLLVKASTTFDVTKLGLKQLTDKTSEESLADFQLDLLESSGNPIVDEELQSLDKKLEMCATIFSDDNLKVITQHYQDFIEAQKVNILNTSDRYASGETILRGKQFLKTIIEQSEEFRTDTLGLLSEILGQSIDNYKVKRQSVISAVPKVLPIEYKDQNERLIKTKLQWSKAVEHYNSNNFNIAFAKGLKEFGLASSSVVFRCKELIKKYIQQIVFEKDKKQFNEAVELDFEELIAFSNNIMSGPIYDIRQKDRELCNAIVAISDAGDFNKNLKQARYSRKPLELKGKDVFIQNYASYWLRNQLLFHNRFETGIELKRTNLILSIGAKYLVDAIADNPIDKLKHEIKTLRQRLLEWNATIDNEDLHFGHISDIEGATYHMYDHMPVFRNFKKKIGKATENLPSEIEMMDTGSYNDLDSKQGKGIQTVSFSVDKIADYLIETRFISTVQGSLAELNKDIHSISGEYLNLRGLLKYNLNKHRTSADTQGLHNFLDKMGKRLDELEESLINSNNSFEAEVEEQLNGTISVLEVQHIIDQADVLTQYVRRQDLRSGIGQQFSRFSSTVNAQLKTPVRFIASRKDELKRMDFEDQNQLLKNSADIIRTFVDTVSPDSRVHEVLPYYYLQLFSDKHLHTGKLVDNRAMETERIIQAIRHIEEGVHGAIMITGPARSGKTFLTDNIVNQHLAGNSYYVTPPAGGAVDLHDLEDAFKSATGMQGKVHHQLQMLEAKSTIVFNDFELWWLNCFEGDRLVNTIVNLIKQFGDRHYFILNCNLHTLNALMGSTEIQEVLVTTVLLRPLTKKALRNELLRRHKIGGINLEYKGSTVGEERTDRRMEKFFNRIYNLSSGNIGFALSIWMSSLRLDKAGMYYMELPYEIDFPNIDDAEWNNVLLQLLLHHSLSMERFEIIYESKGKAWIEKMERELRTSLLLHNPSSAELSMKNHVRPYVEKWFREKGVL
jgi:amino acid transporter